MEIRNVTYKDVYGILSGSLDFVQGENFLVGINGCGKTTVLNLIRWMLGPSLPDLCTLPHKDIKVTIKHGNFLYTIQSLFQKKKHVLRVITKDKSRDFKPISTRLAMDPQTIRGHRDRDDIINMYRHLSPEPDEVSTWRFLNDELPAPVFIGLERSVGDASSSRAIHSRQMFIDDVREPEGRTMASTLMRDAFNTTRQRLVELNEELNRKVIELSFGQVLTNELLKFGATPKGMLAKMEKLKERFENLPNEGTYSKALSSKEVRKAIVDFLKGLSALLNSKDEKDKIWITLNYKNVERAAKMFDLFTDYEAKVRDAQREIRSFSRAVDRFICDSGKSVHFDDDTGSPYIKSSLCADKLMISDLSSGEVQVIVLLSYFAFLAKKGIPIVIDEPELSLHVQWQKYFVEAVKEVMPPECQTLMATHSPEICGADNVNVQAISVRIPK